MKFAKNDGFTLVELIVVIAILAILAGAAVPAYSGYIERAELAADQALLSAVNTAFASTCADNGSDIFLTDDAKFDVAKKEITSVTQGTELSADDLAKYNASFDIFFEGNEEAEFQVIKSVVFDAMLHMFVDPARVDSVTLNYGGAMITVSGEAVAALQNSTFGQTIGAAPLLNEVASLTSWVGGDGEGIRESMGEGYYDQVAKYMGYENGLALDLAIENGALSEEEYTKVMQNGLVLYAADNFSTITDDRITELLNSDNIYGNLAEDNTAQLAEASMVYGLYTGYINSEYYKGTAPSTTDPVLAIQTVSKDPEFKKYVNSEEGQADLEAYKAAMNVIADSTANSTVMTDVLKNGYDNAELISMLQQVMGK